jgi:aspartyl/asparaginyl-tRNA synthetase
MVMHDKTMLRLALLTSIVGVAMLFAYSEKFVVNEQTISRLDELPEGQEVDVTGVVLRVTDLDTVLFMEIAEEKVERVTVVLFKDRNVTVSEGDFVRVVGSLEEYEGKPEILANRLELK